MVITAVYRDGTEKEFEVTKVNGSSFRNDDGYRPVRFILEFGLHSSDMIYLRNYVYPNYDEKFETIINGER